MNTLNFGKICWSLVALLLLATGSLHAVGFTCAGTAYTQPLDPLFLGSALTSDREGSIASADNFRLTERTIINSACWWGIYTECDSDPDSFEITYYMDNSGLPGTVHAGPFAVTTNRYSTGTDNIYGFETTDHPDVTLDGGQDYWIQITNDAAACVMPASSEAIIASNEWQWQGFSLSPDDGKSAQNPGGGFASVTIDLAFNLGGTAAPVEIVPTMSEWGTIVLGLILLCFVTVGIKERKQLGLV